MNSIKRKIFAIALFIFVFTGFSSAQLKPEPKASIKPASYNFGDITQGSIVTTSFLLTNDGDELLKIKKVWASCGCTAATASEKNELKRGESTEIKVTFDSKGKSGVQNKTVYVETNDPKNSVIKFALSGNVIEKGKISSQSKK